ncbi:MAG: hypothetical protein Q8P76_00890 [bacterium]|nr:hypothetical protein [bacterium]
MPKLTAIAGIAAGILALAAFIPYVISILKNQTRPSRATWFIWAIQDILTLASYYASGAKETIWVPIGFTIGATTSAALSVKYGERGWSKLDIACLIGAGISIPTWLMLNDPLIVLLINLFIAVIGVIPTLKKAHLDPASENKPTWILFVISALFNLFAVEEWKFAIVIYPIVIALIDGSVAAVVFWPRRKNSPPASFEKTSESEEAMTNEGGANAP